MRAICFATFLCVLVSANAANGQECDLTAGTCGGSEAQSYHQVVSGAGHKLARCA